MKKLALLLSMVCLLVFIGCGQGEKAEKATVSEPEKATEMAKDKAQEASETVKEETKETTEMAKEETEKNNPDPDFVSGHGCLACRLRR